MEEINEIIEMKMTHRKNIERRKAKFGFDSVSKMGLNMVGAFFNPALSFILINVCQLNKFSTQVGAAVVVPDASDGTEPENPYDGDFFLSKNSPDISLFPDDGGNVALNPAFMD